MARPSEWARTSSELMSESSSTTSTSPSSMQQVARSTATSNSIPPVTTNPLAKHPDHPKAAPNAEGEKRDLDPTNKGVTS
jgi:hypothetical protein